MAAHPALEQRLAAYRERFDATWSDAAPLDQVRFCVLDCETTGLDPQRHRIVSMGAVGVIAGEIDLSDTLELLLRVRFNTASTLVHGITRSATRDALDEPDALAALLEYLGDGVIVGHHISHDLRMIDAALARHAPDRLRNRHLDTGELMGHLLDRAAFGADAELRDYSLDGLCRFFGILPYDRHTAPGDAFLTAGILLRQLRAATRSGCRRLGDLLSLAQPPQPPGE
ncbi:3'-5' exonuclease [Halochromatium sp.]